MQEPFLRNTLSFLTTDAVNSLGSQVYYKDYIADNSNYIFVGVSTGNGSIASGIQTAFTATSTENVWGTKTQGCYLQRCR